MTQKETFLNFIEKSIQQLILHKEIAVKCGVDTYVLDLHDKVIAHFKTLQNVVSNLEMAFNYINQFQNDINKTLTFFPFIQQGDFNFLSDNNNSQFKASIEIQSGNLDSQIKQLEFNFTFFEKLGFFNNNIVAIGANGSGKTTLSNNLKNYLPQNGVVISAQRVLIIPTFSGVSNFNNTSQKLQNAQIADKSMRVTYSTENNGNAYQVLVQLGGEFQILLDNLLAERNVIRNQFCDAFKNEGQGIKVPTTRLDKALKIWNSLIQRRIMECLDGINITLRSTSLTDNYPAHQMSDGEKVVLYLIAQVLQAPSSGFIVVDEPEMYLHKTILRKIWDILEHERKDCIFVYLTHDLDFATSVMTI